MPDVTTLDGELCDFGLDTAVYQPGLNTTEVSRHRGIWIFKATGGDGGMYTDGQFFANLQKARAGEFQFFGAYHFLGDGNGAAQARYFAQVTGFYNEFSFPPTLDIETYGSRRPSMQTVRDFTAEYEQIVQRAWVGPTGKPMSFIDYTGAPMVSSLPPEHGDRDLWLAAYLNPYYPNPWAGVTNGHAPNVAALGSPNRFIPRPWSRWSGWQFAGGDGGVPGAGNGSNNCDQDVFKREFIGRIGGSTPERKDPLADYGPQIIELLQKLASDQAAAEWDTRVVVIDGVEHELEDNIAYAGWASRPYPFAFGSKPGSVDAAMARPDGAPAPDAESDGVQFWLDHEGLAHHIVNPNDFTVSTRVLLNPATQWLPLALKDEFLKQHPIKRHPRPEIHAQLPQEYEQYVLD